MTHTKERPLIENCRIAAPAEEEINQLLLLFDQKGHTVAELLVAREHKVTENKLQRTLRKMLRVDWVSRVTLHAEDLHHTAYYSYDITESGARVLETATSGAPQEGLICGKCFASVSDTAIVCPSCRTSLNDTFNRNDATWKIYNRKPKRKQKSGQLELALASKLAKDTKKERSRVLNLTPDPIKLDQVPEFAKQCDTLALSILQYLNRNTQGRSVDQIKKGVPWERRAIGDKLVFLVKHGLVTVKPSTQQRKDAKKKKRNYYRADKDLTRPLVTEMECLLDAGKLRISKAFSHGAKAIASKPAVEEITPVPQPIVVEEITPIVEPEPQVTAKPNGKNGHNGHSKHELVEWEDIENRSWIDIVKPKTEETRRIYGAVGVRWTRYRTFIKFEAGHIEEIHARNIERIVYGPERC